MKRIPFDSKLGVVVCQSNSVDSSGEFEQLTPQHSPHPDVHSSPCFLQLHLLVSQLLLQLHRITFNNSEGAADRSVVTGANLSF